MNSTPAATPPGDLVIRQALDARARRRFRDLPFHLYGGDPHWVPPLKGAQAKVFARRTVFFRQAEMALFLASPGAKMVTGQALSVDGHTETYHSE